MPYEWMLTDLMLLPVLLAGICILLRSPRAVAIACAVGTPAAAIPVVMTAVTALRHGPLSSGAGWFRLDALSALHMLVMAGVFVIAGICGYVYLRNEATSGHLTLKLARRYGSLWFGSFAAMLLVLISNNLGLLWVGIEASTLLTAFLICIHSTPAALEAMWKYLLMCSVGVALAFTGTLLIAASAGPADLQGAEVMLWTNLRSVAAQLHPTLIKSGFIFIVVGYGVKAGLAPMHNWLPDAHSQAPGPVSAVFSGFLLNAALYGILRCLPLVETATGNEGWGSGILVMFGLLSIAVAAALIVSQQDIKRLLAYSSVEHIGIMVLGFGLGGLGAIAALFHMCCHSLAKTLAFCCAGRIGQIYGTHEMQRLKQLTRASPWLGTGLLAALLTLIGTAPLALFISELLILKTAVDQGRLAAVIILSAGLAVVFIVLLRRMIAMAWDTNTDLPPRQRTHWTEALVVIAGLAVLLALGVYWPPPLARILTAAAAILEGVP
ncbi:MAG: proton-conducting transporter membrane subunit [Kiritimatiellia bacterium]|jgi:hydrogenase-4 component F